MFKNIARKFFIVISLSLLFSQSAFSATTNTTLKRVGLGTYVVYVEGITNLINPAGCESSTYALSEDHKNFDKLFSMLLAAKMANSIVRLGIHNSNCNGKYPQIYYVEVK